MRMVLDDKNRMIAAFPLKKGQIGLTSGTIPDIRLIACVEDGAVILVDYGETVTMVAGDVVACDEQDVIINSGQFHVS